MEVFFSSWTKKSCKEEWKNVPQIQISKPRGCNRFLRILLLLNYGVLSAFSIFFCFTLRLQHNKMWTWKGKKTFFPNYSFIFRSWSSHIMDSQCSSLYFPLIWGIIAAPTAPPPCAHTQKKQLALWCFILTTGWIRRHRDSTASLRWWRQQCLLLQ